jgi:hypothetical protein
MGDTASEVQFELPNKVYNLARSNLEFKVSVPPAGPDRSNALYLMGAPLDKVSVFSREGVYLVDSPNFQQFSKTVTPSLTCREIAKNQDTWDGTSSSKNDKTSFSYNALSDEGGLARITSGGKAIVNENTSSSMDTVAVSDNAPSSIRVRLNLKEIHHSLLSCDRVMYFGQSLILRVHFAAKKGFGFSFVTNEKDDLTLPAADVAGIAGDVTISDLKLNLAVETSPDIIEGLVARVQSAGLQVMVPYVYGFLYTTPRGSANVNQQIRVNAGHGQRLTHVISSHFDNNSNVLTSSYLDNSNSDADGASSKVLRYQTSIDNNNLQEYVIDTRKGEDYELLKPTLIGSTVKDVDDFESNRCHMDSWRAGKSCSWRERDCSEVDGTSLESERIWNINVEDQVANDGDIGGDLSYRLYTWMVTQRTLTIQPNGQIVMA